MAGAGVDVQRDVARPHLIIPLLRRPNTNSTPNKPRNVTALPTFDTVTRARVSSTLSRYGVKRRGNVTSVYPPLEKRSAR